MPIKDKTFQIMVLLFLGLILVVGLISAMKSKNQAGQTQIRAFGKTLWTSKKADVNVPEKKSEKQAG